MKAVLQWTSGKYRISQCRENPELNGRVVPIDKYSTSYLPMDHIQFHLEENIPILDKLIFRYSQYTLGVITHIRYGFYTIHFPLFQEYCHEVKPVSDFSKKFRIGDKILFYVTESGLEYHYSCEHMSEREIIRYIYEHSNNPHVLEYLCDTQKSTQSVEYKDLTHLDTFTVDPPQCRDYDDAISFDKQEQRVWVHIVDIDAGIQLCDDSEVRSLHLGSTLYFPDGDIIPMIPDYERMALIQGHVRPTITLEWNLKTQEVEIYRSIIKVKHRYDYENAGCHTRDWDWWIETTEKLSKNLEYHPIPQLEFKNNQPIQNLPCSMHKWIAYWMIETNSHISRFYDMPQRHHPENHDAVILPSQTVTDRLKQYRKAEYSLEKGHAGLRKQVYTHFTSPLRRCPDFIAHRIYSGSNVSNIERLLDYFSFQEWRIRQMISHFKKWMLCNVCERQTDWQGTVIQVHPSGVTIFIENLLLEVYIHVSNLLNTRWRFENDKLLSNHFTIQIGTIGILQVKSIFRSLGKIEFRMHSTLRDASLTHQRAI